MKTAREIVANIGGRQARQNLAIRPEIMREFVSQVQADALEYAGQMMTCHADNPEKAFEIIHGRRVSIESTIRKNIKPL